MLKFPKSAFHTGIHAITVCTPSPNLPDWVNVCSWADYRQLALPTYCVEELDIADPIRRECKFVLA